MTSVYLHRGRDGKLRGFTVSGHAGSGDAGYDLVCAGVSILTHTAANALETVAGIEHHPHVRDGYMSVRLPRGLNARQRRTAQIILRTARQGFYDMAKAYPKYIRICQD